MAFRFGYDVSNPQGPSAIPVALPPPGPATLHLNAFQGEPAITEFDWPFTPYPQFIPGFSLVGSVLHTVLPLLQLTMGRSPFGSRTRDKRHLSDSLSLRIPQVKHATYANS